MLDPADLHQITTNLETKYYFATCATSLVYLGKPESIDRFLTESSDAECIILIANSRV